MNKVEEFEPFQDSFTLDRYNTAYQKERADLIWKILPAPSSNKHAVDVGCGPGFFSRRLIKLGWSVTGIDTSADNLQKISEYTEKTLHGDAVSMLRQIDSSSLGLVFASEIIEHMPRAMGISLLTEAHRVLEPGGVLFLSTPNKLSPEGLGGYFIEEKLRKNGTWQAWDPSHIYIYSSREMRRELRNVGFNVNKLAGYYYRGYLPLIRQWGLPLKSSCTFPMNYLGFNSLFVCTKENVN